MGQDISVALPGDSFKKVGSAPGWHDAYYLGVSSTWISKFDCKDCDTKGTVFDQRTGDQIDCPKCKGEGKQTVEQIKMLYELRDGVTEEESMKNSLWHAPQGGIKATFYKRLKGLSEIADPAEIAAWHKGLAEPIRVPCRIKIELDDPKNPNSRKRITEAEKREAPAKSSKGYEKHAVVDAYPPKAKQEPLTAMPSDDELAEAFDSEIPF